MNALDTPPSVRSSTSRRWLWLAVLGVLLLLGVCAPPGLRPTALPARATIPTSVLRGEFPILPQEKGIVADATRRWVAQNHGDARAMDGRIPMVIEIPWPRQGRGERCVMLHPRAPTLGESPVYCYSAEAYTSKARTGQGAP